MASDLSSIPGLRPKHVAVLTGSLQIRTAPDLVHADRRVVHAAMRRLRPAPTLEEIASWQDQARDLAKAVPAEPSGPHGWEQAAAFVVSFETRQAGAEPERRLVVEQVEQAPPEPRQEWRAWPREAAWTWMLDRIAAEGGAGPRPAAAGQAGRPPVTGDSPAAGEHPEPASARQQPGAGDSPAAGENSQTASAGQPRRVPPAITAGAPELVLADGRVRRMDVGGPAVDIPPSAVLRITAATVPALPLQVALRLRRAGRPSYAPSPPMTAVSGEAAEIDLDCLPAGEHTAVLTIWTAGGRAAAAVIPMPRLRVPPHS